MIYRKTFLIALAAVALFVPIHFTSSVRITSQAVVTVARAAAATPIYLTIPNAKVNTNIIDVGITQEGNLDVPPNYTEVGWYKYGTRPGEVGSAVLDGHVDDGGSIPGPFKNLRDLKIGDDIYVTMSSGERLHYKVTVSEVFKLKDFPGEKIFHETGNKFLKIITCHGKYVPSIKTYDQRLIVTAVLVP